MKTLHFEHLHDGCEQVRSIVEVIDNEMSILFGRMMRDDPHATRDHLQSSWATLVKLLSLGPVRETRVCPVCAHIGMHDARRCGYCWTMLAPLAAAVPVAAISAA